MIAATPIRDLTEKQLEKQLLDLLAATAWTQRYHTFRSKKSPAGFPDEVWVRERIIFAELKTETKPVSDAQKAWLRALLAAGAEVYLIRPRHLEQIALILAARQYPDSTWSRGTTENAIASAYGLRDDTRKEAAAD